MLDHTDAPRCTAIAKSTGRRCKRRPHPGAEVCVKHGAGAPQVRAAAARRLEAAEQERAAAEAVRRFGLAAGEDVPALDPRAVLAEELWRTLKVVRGLEAEVAELAAIHGPTFHATGRRTGEARPHVTWQMWQQQREHLRSVAEACHRAGIEDFRVSLEAASAELTAGLFRTIFADPDLGMAPEQRDAALMIAGRHLRLLDAGNEDVIDGGR